jgi:hypothetical protein
MPRVVPSEVVGLIERIFPSVGTADQMLVSPAHAPILAAVVRLTDSIPRELIQISGGDYSDLILGLEGLQYIVDLWRERGGVDVPQRIEGVSPVVLVHRALCKCPDQTPAVGTTDLPQISDVDLRRSIRQDMDSAAISLHSGDYKSATVMAGAAVEALLLWSIQNKASAGAVVGLTPKPTGSPEGWGLADYIDVAKRLSLIEADTATQAGLGRNFRNLIHPGKAARTNVTCDRGTAHAALAAMELVARDVAR